MRISFAILLIVTILLPVGCNSDLRCRRETALLRAEYLDLEDKYYSLLAQSEEPTIVDGTASVASGYENAVILDSGLPVDSGFENGVVLDSGQPVGSGVIYDQGQVSPNLANPEIIYYDESPGYQSGQIISPSNQVIYGGVIDTIPTPAGPTLASPLPNGSSTRSGSAVEASPVLDGIDSGDGRGLPADLFDNSEPLPAVDSPSGETVIDEFDGISILDPNAPHLKTASSKTAAQVTDVQINPSVSRGENTDGIAGDDELKLLLQPMTADGNVVEQAGNLTISVVDPAAEQGQQQVGYWEFVRSETELFFARDEFDNRGLLLNLPWSDDPPTNANLTVYVRYETQSGNVIETTDSVTIDPPSLSLDYAEVEELDNDSSGDWYRGQARRRSYGEATRASSIKRPFENLRSSQQSSDDDYYRPSAWKPVR